MSRKNKTPMMAITPSGMEVKVWVNRKTGAVIPTNWKLQAPYLANPTGEKRK